MQKTVIRTAFFALALVLMLAATPVVSVMAHEGHDHGEDKTAVSSRDELKRTSEELKLHLEQQKERRQQFAEKRLDASKLRVCEKRKEKITGIMQRSTARAENQIKVFDSIAERTKTFYEKKGNTLANYAALVATVESAKAKVESDLRALKSIEPFDCSSNDPKGVADDFKTAMKTLTDDLKTYRTTVKDLIVGVKSVQGGERSRQ